MNTKKELTPKQSLQRAELRALVLKDNKMDFDAAAIDLDMSTISLKKYISRHRKNLEHILGSVPKGTRRGKKNKPATAAEAIAREYSPMIKDKSLFALPFLVSNPVGYVGLTGVMAR